MPLLHMGIEKGSRPVELFISNNALLKENVKPSVLSFNYLTYRVFIKYCVFPKILEYFGLWPFSVFPWCQCVYTHQAGRTPALQQNWQS